MAYRGSRRGTVRASDLGAGLGGAEGRDTLSEGSRFVTLTTHSYDQRRKGDGWGMRAEGVGMR
jgi:hypothetical protein